MSDSSRPNDKPQAAGEQREVLASLPRHRPQRLTARREATRTSQSAKKPPIKPARQAAASPAKAGKPKARKVSPVDTPARQLAPKQGFDIDDPQLGRSVEPPNGSEILLSALRLSGSVAQGSISASGRLLKDALRRLH